VASEPGATPPAAPLYDTLADHQPSGVPIIPQAGKRFDQATAVTLIAPLYHQPGDLHYTLDGSDPTASSPAYVEPIECSDPVKVAVAQIDEHGQRGPIIRGDIEIHDNTPPTLNSLLAEKNMNALHLTFSKALDPATAVDPQNYVVEPALAISQVTPSPDGREVTVTFAKPIPAGTDFTLKVSGLKDRSANGNMIAPTALPFDAQNIAYAFKSAQLPTKGLKSKVAGLPLSKNDAWTMNVLVKPDRAPEDRIIIAGFGLDEDNSDGGTSRYFAVMDNGLRFWSANRDVVTRSPLEVGRWQMLTATYNGRTLTLYKDGASIGRKDVELSDDASSFVNIGTPDPWEHERSFHGAIQSFTIRRGALTPAEVKELFAKTKPD